MHRTRSCRTSPIVKFQYGIDSDGDGALDTWVSCQPGAAGARRTSLPRPGRRSTGSRRFASASSPAPNRSTARKHAVSTGCCSTASLRRQERLSRTARRNDRRHRRRRLSLSRHSKPSCRCATAVEPGLMSRHAAAPSPPRAQRGVVLLVAMMAIVALALAGIALDRAVATDATIGGNVARANARDAVGVGRRSSMRSAALFETGAIADRPTDDLAAQLFCVEAGGRGWPRRSPCIAVIANYPADAAVDRRGRSASLRYRDRAAVPAAGAASAENCTLSPPSVAAARGTPGASEPPRTPDLPRHRSRRRSRGRRRVRAGDARRNADAPPAVVAGPR